MQDRACVAIEIGASLNSRAKGSHVVPVEEEERLISITLQQVDIEMVYRRQARLSQRVG